MNRKINKLIIHCSDSDVSTHNNISVIREWHLLRGFNDVGYHYFINWEGDIQVGRSEDVVGAHCEGQNANSIGICLQGRSRFTSVQFYNVKILILDLLKRYNLTVKDVYPHNYFNKAKTCPNFDISNVINKL